MKEDPIHKKKNRILFLFCFAMMINMYTVIFIYEPMYINSTYEVCKRSGVFSLLDLCHCTYRKLKRTNKRPQVALRVSKNRFGNTK